MKAVITNECKQIIKLKVMVITASRKDERWAKGLLEWRSRHRIRGRPPTRWADDIKRIDTKLDESGARLKQVWQNLREP